MKTQEDFKSKFFEGMSFAAATVNIITTDGPFGRKGVTVSAMSSVSADTTKPTLLVCINEKSSAAAAILENGVFCVNVLRDHQSFISDAFAGRYKDQLKDKFDCTSWITGELGLPRVSDALVAFDCKIISTKKVGTHHVCFGEVQDIFLGRSGSALIYANRAYGSSSRIETPQFVPTSTLPNELGALRIGCFHSFAPFVVPKLASSLKNIQACKGLEIVEGDGRRIREGILAGELDAGFVYYKDSDCDLEIIPLRDLEPYILLPKSHNLASQNVIDVQDLNGLDMISIKEQESRDMLEGALREAGVVPNIVFHASSFEVARGMVGQGFGFAVLMTKPASSMTYDGMQVVARNISEKIKPGRIGLAHRLDIDPKVLQVVKWAATTVFS